MFNKICKTLILISIVSYLSIAIKSEMFAITPTVGNTYYTYSDYSNQPKNPTLGYAKREKYGVASLAKKEVSDNVLWTNEKRHKDYEDLTYILFMFPNIVNMTIEKHLTSYVYINKDTVYSHTVTKTVGTTLNYSQSASTELQAKFSNSTELEVSGINFGKAKNTSHYEVSSKISNTVSVSRSYTYTSTESETFTIDNPKSAYYMLETRGNFNVFVLQTFKVQHVEINRKHHGLPGKLGYNTWEWAKTGYKLVEQTVYYSYIPDTSSKGFFEYISMPDRFTYNDIKNDGLIYY